MVFIRAAWFTKRQSHLDGLSRYPVQLNSDRGSFSNLRFRGLPGTEATMRKHWVGPGRSYPPEATFVQAWGIGRGECYRKTGCQN
jgi:hypothetical protein